MSKNYNWGSPESALPNEWANYTGNLATASATIEAQPGVAETFAAMADEWIAETAVDSSLARRYAHPAYQRIVGLGPAVVPILLAELEADPNFWFHALRSITGANPVTEQMRGNLRAMTDAWLEWGRTQGYLT